MRVDADTKPSNKAYLVTLNGQPVTHVLMADDELGTVVHHKTSAAGFPGYETETLTGTVVITEVPNGPVVKDTTIADAEKESRLAVVEQLELEVRKLRHAMPLDRKQWRAQLIALTDCACTNEVADLFLYGTGSTINNPKGIINVQHG